MTSAGTIDTNAIRWPYTVIAHELRLYLQGYCTPALTFLIQMIKSGPRYFIHSFGLFLLRLFKPTITQRRSRHTLQHGYCVRVSHSTASEVLAQGPYVTAKEGFELTTLQMKGYESTNEPPRPVICYCSSSFIISHDKMVGHISITRTCK